MTNHNRKGVTGEDNSRKVIDLSGKKRRKATKLAPHQAFSSLFYKNLPGPEGTLYREVQVAYATYTSGDTGMANRFQVYLNPKGKIEQPIAKKMIFQQAYMRECLLGSSTEVLSEVQRHIDARYALDSAKVEAPWLPGKTEDQQEVLSSEIEAKRLAYYQKSVLSFQLMLLSDAFTGISISCLAA